VKLRDYLLDSFVVVVVVWEDAIKMDLKEIGRECVEWIYLVQDKVAYSKRPSHSIKKGNVTL
jgi:hypothetical protein